MMKKRTLLILSVFLLMFTAAIAVAPLTVEQVIKDAAKYDGKPVVVVGKVKDYVEKTSKKGNKYVTFKLVGAKEEASVYLRDRLTKPVKNGDRVEVSGVFRKEKKLPTFTVKNEIDATKQEGKTYGVKSVK